jgi:hypothetical protein
MSFLDDAIGSIGQGLAQTAVSAISAETGVNVGGALGYLFGNGQTMGGQNMAALGPAVENAFPSGTDNTLLQADLKQQTSAISAMGIQLGGIVSSLAQITGMIQNIQAMLLEIDEEQKFTEWQAADNEITNYIVKIDSAYNMYAGYIAKYPTTPTSEVRQLRDDILDPNDGPLAGLGGINQYMLDSDEGRGALHLWTAMVRPLVQRGVLDYRLAVQQYFQYYQKLTYAQLKATNLLVEAYRFNVDQPNADAIWAQYRSQLLSQENVFITWLVPLVYAGVEGGVFVPQGQTTQRVNFTCYDATLQLNSGIQYVRGDADPGNGFYEPSSIFRAAEQLLATLYVTAPTDRRIVVHMSYPNGMGINTLLSGLFVTLSPSGTSSIIPSFSNTVLGSPFPFPSSAEGDYSPFFPDQNIYTGNGFYLNRYVFKDDPKNGLTDGQYNLTDLNGHNGLVAKETYLSNVWTGPQPQPFQQNNVLKYTMQVNSASPFDFMNFSAYTFPSLMPG